MRAITDKILDATLALVYPQACAVCGSESVESRKDGIACDSCWQKTRIFSGRETVCWKCGALAQSDIDEEKRAQVFCRRCDGDDFDAARAVGVYEGALRASVLSLKREAHISTRLVRQMFDAYKREPLCVATRIAPVPLHAERLKERGFNQAAVLAWTLAKLTRLPIDETSIVRAIHTTRHRAGMDARARRESVQDSFQVVSPKLIEGENVLLVDDVFTTGATVSACAKALKDAGASRVFVLTVARPLM
jgi:ComF family protein